MFLRQVDSGHGIYVLGTDDGLRVVSARQLALAPFRLCGNNTDVSSHRVCELKASGDLNIMLVVAVCGVTTPKGCAK